MLWSCSASIGHVNKYPTMHHNGNLGHTQSMIAYKIWTEKLHCEGVVNIPYSNSVWCYQMAHSV